MTMYTIHSDNQLHFLGCYIIFVTLIQFLSYYHVNYSDYLHTFFFYFTFFWMGNILVQYLLNSSFIDSARFLNIFGAIEAIVRI